MHERVYIIRQKNYFFVEIASDKYYTLRYSLIGQGEAEGEVDSGAIDDL